MGPNDKVNCFHFSDPDATDSDADSLSRCQKKRSATTIVISQSIPRQNKTQNPELQHSPQQRQTSSKYPGVYKREYGKWGARLGSGTRPWLGTFATEEEAHKAVEERKAEIAKAKASARECELCQTAGQQCQLCQKTAQPDQAMTQQMAAAAKSRVKKRKEKVEKKASTKVLTVLGPPMHSQFVVSEENVSTKNKNPKMDTICEADKSKLPVTSAAPVRVGSTPLVHDPSAMPQGFWGGFDLESIPDADLGIDNSNSGAEDPIQLDDVPLWTGNLDFGDWSFLDT